MINLKSLYFRNKFTRILLYKAVFFNFKKQLDLFFQIILYFFQTHENRL